MRKYEVTLRDQYGNRSTVEYEAEDVQIAPQGHAKFLIGKGRDAVLVAFHNVEDIVGIVNKAVK